VDGREAVGDHDRRAGGTRITDGYVNGKKEIDFDKGWSR
jgi:hypothetical protein